MPLTYTIDPQHKIIHTIGRGNITLGDLAVHMKAVTEDPLFQPGMNTIADVRTAKILMSIPDTPDLIRLFIQQAKIRKRGRWAVVMTRYPEVHLIRFFISFMEHLPFNMSVFDSDTDAIRWIRKRSSDRATVSG